MREKVNCVAFHHNCIDEFRGERKSILIWSIRGVHGSVHTNQPLLMPLEACGQLAIKVMLVAVISFDLKVVVIGCMSHLGLFSFYLI